MRTIYNHLAILTFAAAALLPNGVAVAYEPEGDYSIYAWGTASCAKVLEWYRTDNSFYLDSIGWVGGFITAAGIYNYSDTQKEFGDVADIDGIMHLIREYCEENPLDNLTKAAYNVAEHLIYRAGRR